MKGGRLQRGVEGEDAAIEYLERRMKWKVVARNYKSKAGEIDIIARGPDGIVFVEVKSRAALDLFNPSLNVHWQQLKRIRRSAQLWLDRHAPTSSARIDVLGVSNGEVVEHYEDV
jgi:putative endonuclease